MSSLTPAPRSIVSVTGLPEGMKVLCDCGTPTHIVILIETPEGQPMRLARPADAAFTCQGCQTSHWFTVWPPASHAGDLDFTTIYDGLPMAGEDEL